MKAMEKTRTRFRSDPARGIEAGAAGIDREAGIIYGYSVITAGEARGHGLEIDRQTLDQVVTLGNSRKNGLKSRFGHPQMSSESLGTLLGRSKNFRIDDGNGRQVRADLHIDPTAYKTPNGDLAHYVLDLAESDPEAFGASIVFAGDPEYRLNPDGTPKRDRKGRELPPLARVETLYAADVVDDPAANDGGMFGLAFMTADCELSARAGRFLDRFLEDPGAVRKLMAFLRRYAGEEIKEDDKMSTKKKVEDEGAPAEVVEVAKEETPALAEKTYTETELQAVVQRTVQAALQGERERVAAIEDGALPGQEELAKKAVKDGLSVAAAYEVFLRDRKATEKERLAQLQTDTLPDLGPNADSTLPAAAKPSGIPTEAELETRWAEDSTLRSEWIDDRASYLAYHRALAKGTIRDGGGLATIEK